MPWDGGGSGSPSAISGSLKVLAHDLGKGTQPLPACVSFPVYIACTPFRQSSLTAFRVESLLLLCEGGLWYLMCGNG